MHDDLLAHLIRSADAETRLQIAPAELARQTRARNARHRRRVRMLAVAAPLLLLAGGAALWWSRSGEIAPSPAQLASPAVLQSPALADSSELPPEIASQLEHLRAEAEYYRHLAECLLALDERDRAVERARAAHARPLSPDRTDEQLDSVAFQMVRQADALQAAMSPNAKAAAMYQEVLRLFPHTQSAALARQRLHELGI